MARTNEASEGELTFEQALEELDTIVRELEEGKIPLAEGLARYEVAVKLLARCYQLLEHVERRIEVLNRVDSAGNPSSEPFDDCDLSLEEKAQTRGRRRARPSAAEQQLRDDEIDGPGRLF